MSNLLNSLRLARGTRAMVLAVSALVGCAEAEEALEQALADAGQQPSVDSSIPWTPADAGPVLTFDAGQSFDSGAVSPVDASIDSSATSSDAGQSDAAAGDAGGFLGGLFGSDAGWTPPPGTADGGTTSDAGGPTSPDNPDGWKLNPDSAKDCPALPPPIPIIGGLCAGIYFGCGWTNAEGAKYSCVCDWIHWLCI